MNIWRWFSFFVFLFVVLTIFYVSSLSLGASKVGFYVTLKPLIYHFGIFFFLGFFLLYSIGIENRKAFFFGIIFAVLYAISDEIHQSFIPFRAFSLFDIFIDSLGVLSAVVIYFVYRDFWKWALSQIRK